MKNLRKILAIVLGLIFLSLLLSIILFIFDDGSFKNQHFKSGFEMTQFFFSIIYSGITYAVYLIVVNENLYNPYFNDIYIYILKGIVLYSIVLFQMMIETIVLFSIFRYLRPNNIYIITLL